MEKEGFLMVELSSEGIAKSHSKQWRENNHSQGTELVIIKKHFLFPELVALVTCARQNFTISMN